jgi:hypothetical protein
MPEISTTLEVEIRFAVQGQPGKTKKLETPFHHQEWWYTSVIPDTWEA